MQLINQLSEDKHVSCEDMQLLCSLPGSSQSSEMLCIRLRQHLLAMRHLPVVRLLVTKEKTDLGTLFAEADANNTVEVSTPSPFLPPPSLLPLVREVIHFMFYCFCIYLPRHLSGDRFHLVCKHFHFFCTQHYRVLCSIIE